MNHSEKAIELFNNGYNCAQAVFGAFEDEIGLDFETAIKLSSSFGGGIGGLGETCGAASAMFMVVGLLDGYTVPGDDSIKKEHFKRIQKLASDFEKNNGSMLCRELLANLKNSGGTPNGERPCTRFVRSAAEVLDEYIQSRNK